MGSLKDITNRRFGLLIAVEIDSRNKHGKIKWKCRCDCGKIKLVLSNSLLSGGTISCGCWRKNHPNHFVHGQSHKNITEYTIWNSMKTRCLNSKNKAYKNYGGRGITICKRWINSFINFRQDMGLRPGPEYSLDRIDNDENYCPKNCRWATRKEQANNTRRNKNKS